MGYDFFDENTQPQKDENMPERAPAPYQNGEMPPIGKKKKAKWGKIVSSILLTVAVFGLGMLTTWVSLDPEIRTIISVKKKIQDDYYKEVTDEDFYKAIFGGINNDLLDSYSGYMTPEEFSTMVSDMEGNRIGLGLTFSKQASEPLRITYVCGNSPAERAGILVGETIVGCGSTEESLSPCSTFREFSDLLAEYEEKEEFCLKLCLGSAERTVKVYKAEYVENYVFYRTKDSAYAFTGEYADEWTKMGDPLTYLDEDTAYIRLLSFTGNAEETFAFTMEQFRREGKKNLILDLRGNGGGYLDVMQSISRYFCKSATGAAPIVAVADFGEKKTSYKAMGNVYGSYFSADSKIYVLADRYSASASECLIGCMLDYGTIDYNNICLAERDGVAKTFGKGIMQETSYVNPLKKDAITLTTAEIRWPLSGNSIHDRGVLPADGALIVKENIDFETETKNAIEKLLG